MLDGVSWNEALPFTESDYENSGDDKSITEYHNLVEGDVNYASRVKLACDDTVGSPNCDAHNIDGLPQTFPERFEAAGCSVNPHARFDPTLLVLCMLSLLYLGRKRVQRG